MRGPEKNCEDMHHKSYFLLELRRIENLEFHVRLSEGVDHPVNPLPKEGVFVVRNMANIYETKQINFSTKPGFVENIYIRANSLLENIVIYTTLFKEFCNVFACSYKELPGIDPSIVEHEIMTYHNIKLVQKNTTSR